MLAAAVLSKAADFPVKHLRPGRHAERGQLSIQAAGIDYAAEKAARQPRHLHWTWNDIQRLVLSDERLEIVTYKDVKWLAGRDRHFLFAGSGLSQSYELLRDRLPRRFVPRIARMDFRPLATFPAKWLEGRSGHEGTLLIGADRLVFQAEGRGGSETWILGEVDNISSSDPMEFTIASLGAEYRFQLKQPMPESVYDGLWRKLNTRRHS